MLNVTVCTAACLLVGLVTVESLAPTSRDTSALASSLSGTLIAYNVSGDPQPTCTVNCGGRGLHLWSYLEVSFSVLGSAASKTVHPAQVYHLLLTKLQHAL